MVTTVTKLGKTEKLTNYFKAPSKPGNIVSETILLARIIPKAKIAVLAPPRYSKVILI